MYVAGREKVRTLLAVAMLERGPRGRSAGYVLGRWFATCSILVERHSGLICPMPEHCDTRSSARFPGQARGLDWRGRC